MRTIIDRTRWAQIKTIANSTARNQTAANRAGVSLETIRRVKNSKTFLEYQANNVKAHSAPKPGTVVKPTATVAEPVKTPVKRRKSSNTTIFKPKKKTAWQKFLAFFDII